MQNKQKGSNLVKSVKPQTKINQLNENWKTSKHGNLLPMMCKDLRLWSPLLSRGVFFSMFALCLWDLQRCIKIKNDVKRKKYPPKRFQPTVWQNISISIIGTIVIVDFRTLRPFSLWIDTLLEISPSFVRSIKVHSDQEWRERKGKNNLDNFCKPHPWKIPF